MITKIKNEAIFVYFANKENTCVPTEIGKQQFFMKQSKGIMPKNADDYYTFLMRGKWQFDFLSRELQQAHINGEWWGWDVLKIDWKDNLNILRKLCSWHKNIPEYIN